MCSSTSDIPSELELFSCSMMLYGHAACRALVQLNRTCYIGLHLSNRKLRSLLRQLQYCLMNRLKNFQIDQIVGEAIAVIATFQCP